MIITKNKCLFTLSVLLIAIFVFLADFTELSAAKNKKKSSGKSKISYEAQVQQKKEERIKKLYEYFPIYTKWEQAEIYPYNDFAFLNDFDRNSIYESFENRKKLLHHINDWLGVRYRNPGRSRQGIDCSNFCSVIIMEVLNKNIPAGAATQATLFPRIDKIADLQFGDFIFFADFIGVNKRTKRIGHVGIYIGNGLFAHSATNHGVIYTHISEGYYTERFRFGGRIMRKNLETAFSNSN